MNIQLKTKHKKGRPYLQLIERKRENGERRDTVIIHIGPYSTLPEAIDDLVAAHNSRLVEITFFESAKSDAVVYEQMLAAMRREDFPSDTIDDLLASQIDRLAERIAERGSLRDRLERRIAEMRRQQQEILNKLLTLAIYGQCFLADLTPEQQAWSFLIVAEDDEDHLFVVPANREPVLEINYETGETRLANGQGIPLKKYSRATRPGPAWMSLPGDDDEQELPEK